MSAKRPKKAKRNLVFVSILVALALVSIFSLWNQGPRFWSTTVKESTANDEIGETYLKKSFGDGNFLYTCSKDIEVIYEGSSHGPGEVYRPVNQEQFSKYCRSDAVIEYKAVIDILKRQDVDSLIEKYDTTQASVRALGHAYIQDKDYLNRILPAYSDVKIDCIIVVHSPERTRFFIEDGEVHDSHDDHQYREVPAKEFLTSLNNASSEDVTNFWLGLH